MKSLLSYKQLRGADNFNVFKSLFTNEWTREWQTLCNRTACSLYQLPQQGHTSMMRMHYHTLRLILSIWRFWFSNSEPMSIAMLRRLPIIVLTCPMFSSISSSRASFVILDLNIFDKHSNQLSNFPGHCPLSALFYTSFSQESILLLFQYQSTDWDIHLTVCFSNLNFIFLRLIHVIACEIAGFCYGLVKVFTHIWFYCTAQVGSSLMIWDNILVPPLTSKHSRIKEKLTIEDGTHMLPQNIGDKPTYTLQQPKISYMSVIMILKKEWNIQNIRHSILNQN